MQVFMDFDKALAQQALVAETLRAQARIIRNSPKFGVQVGVTGDADILEAAARVLDRLTAQGREFVLDQKGGEDE